jgi:hypothetical protein
MKLNVCAFGVACALWWGIGLFVLTWWVIATGGAEGGPSLLERVYIGYTITPLGSVIGLAWGLADGLVGGVIFAWLYNLLGAKLFARSGA